MKKFFRLSSGRKLSYFDHAPEESETIIFFHGVPSDHTAILSLPSFPFVEGFRVILIDRPGYGDSDSNPTMGYSRIASEIEELADELEIDRFYVQGTSGGGPWALATAGLLKERVKGVILISPMGPLTPEVFNEVNKVNQRVYWVSKRFPSLMRINTALLGFAMRHFPFWYLDQVKGKFSGPDQEAMKEPETHEILQAVFAHAARKTSFGLYQDVVNQANQWDFELSDVTAPVVVHQGEADIATPPAVGRHFEEMLKNVKVHFVPNAGHLWSLTRMPEIMKTSLGEIGHDIG